MYRFQKHILGELRNNIIDIKFTKNIFLFLQIQAVYVITSCVISAPCTLAVSKLVYPETKKSKFTSDEGLTLEKS